MIAVLVMVGVDCLQDLLSTQDKLTHAEVRCQSLAAEKERLKSTEARLVSENEMLHRNQQTRDQLVISLEAIQVCSMLQTVILVAILILYLHFMHLVFNFLHFYSVCKRKVCSKLFQEVSNYGDADVDSEVRWSGRDKFC